MASWPGVGLKYRVFDRRTAKPADPWLRNDIDHDIVWQIATADLPALVVEAFPLSARFGMTI